MEVCPPTIRMRQSFPSPIWLDIADIARRILQRIGAVLDFAHIKGWREAGDFIENIQITAAMIAAGH